MLKCTLVVEGALKCDQLQMCNELPTCGEQRSRIEILSHDKLKGRDEVHMRKICRLPLATTQCTEMVDDENHQEHSNFKENEGPW